MGQFLSKAFVRAAVVSTAHATLATLSGAIAETPDLSTSKSGIETQLNLQSNNTFYIPGIGVRIDEACEMTDAGDAHCTMEVIYGADTRVQTAQVMYETDGGENLTGITAIAENGKFFDVAYSRLDERMAALSTPHNEALLEEAEAGGFDTITARIQSNLDAYRHPKTSIYEAMQEGGDPSLHSKLQLLDGVVKIDRGEAVHSATQTSCTVIPVAGAETTSYDVDVPESYRSLCVQQGFNKGGNVTTTVAISGLTDGGALQQANFMDVRSIEVIGAANPAQTSVFDERLHGLLDNLNGNPAAYIVSDPSP